MNKKAQGLSTNAIILIVLGVIVLVILIAGFTMGWGKLAPWLSTNNVDTIATACETACVTNSIYDFCSKERELNDGEDKIKTSCYVFSITDGLTKYGVQKCSLDCKKDIPCTGWQYDRDGLKINVKVTVDNTDKTSDYCTS